MTRYKKYLQQKGCKLECDYEYLPYHGLETVRTEIKDRAILVSEYYSFYGWVRYLVSSDGAVMSPAD